MANRHLVALVAGLGLAALGLAGAIAFGTAAPPAELSAISAPFRSVDFSDAPPVERLPADPATPIAFRRWGPPDAAEVVVLLHGSTASSLSLHPLAKALAAAGVTVYAPDIRGHGDTGRRGDVDFVGQPEQDVARLLREAKSRHPAARLTLAGFSLGGGLALRVAGGRDGAIADRTLLLAPMLGPRAPTARGGDDPWARPHLPRIIALSILNRLGVGAFDHLEAIAYAVPTGSERTQTGRYSWRLLRSLMPADYAADLSAAPRPVHVLVGADDQLFHADRYAPAVRAARPDARVDIVPGVDHIGLTLTPAGHAAIAAALR